MGLSADQRKRVRVLAQEAKEIFGGAVNAEGRPLTFAELEDECIEASDLFSSELLGKRVAERPPAEQPACCPGCQQPGEACPEEPRVLETNRGEVGWMEPAYYCRRCRRSFFPSLG